MNGLGSGPPSKSSAARSARTIGATGRNCSRPLTSLSRSVLRRVARVGEQAAVAEGARPELAAPLEPGDDAVGGQHLGDRLGHVAGPLVGDRGAVEPRRELGVAPAAAERGGRHRRGPVAELARRPRGRRPARCPSRRRPAAPRVVERALAPEPRVGHAVERDAAGQRQARLARLLVQPAGQVDEHLLQPALDAAGEVGVRGQPVARRRVSAGAKRAQSTASVAKPPSPVGADQLAEARRGAPASRRRPWP